MISKLTRPAILSYFVISSGMMMAGVFEQIASSSVCTVSSPVFLDAPKSVGVVQAVGQQEKMGFFVDDVSVTGSTVTVSWKTDVEPPYEARYVFDKPTNATFVTVRNLTFPMFSCSLPEGAKMIHVEVGCANGLVPENKRRADERKRAFSVPCVVADEFYYDVMSRRTSPYKGASYIFASEQAGGPFRAMLFSATKDFQYQLSIPLTNGTQTIVSSVHIEPNADALLYGVGYRLTYSEGSSVTFLRAFSANPDRSDAKIVRLFRD